MATPVQIVIDCADPAKLAAFWEIALGYQVQPPPGNFSTWEEALAAQGIPMSEWNSATAVIDPARRGPRVFFQRVPERKTVKNRVHLDLQVSGVPYTPPEQAKSRIDAEVDRLIGAGATVVEGRDGRAGEHWVVMRDPEGNEFCVT